jgi:DNA topoisomerase-3
VILLCLTLTQKKNIREPIHTITKGSTVNLKDFKTDLGTVDGLLRFDENFKLKLEPKKIATPPKENKARPNLYPVLNVKRNSNQRKYRLWM